MLLNHNGRTDTPILKGEGGKQKDSNGSKQVQKLQTQESSSVTGGYALQAPEGRGSAFWIHGGCGLIPHG